MHTAFHLYNLIMGVLATAGLGYLFYLHQYEIEYNRFVFVTVTGIVIFALVAPVIEAVVQPLVHFAHAVAALFIIFGLYDPVNNDLRKEQWAELLLKDPTTIRKPSEWMVPMDDRILELFHTSDLVLTPALIAYNIDYSREEVNRRLSELEEHGLVDRVERGKYRITDLGEKYLDGRLHVALLDNDETTESDHVNSESEGITGSDDESPDS
ncbi:hypothetical protein AArcSl_1592 [Halalkaliarchaeum desulfuricum]|uniref:HTH crp-type domain-containing protein n=1 Tax=Halalkaliarchaeum desulfuricum TaxID=2055893 RepID=A0A343TJE9_9EURY|nr:winged-helix domain-containing protein [Halalkaliarchaeum desulfuricum]AUX09221.1 hypothetical protein AArcSl_1592 [Halalkaliarchaeum desulfuricum]